MKLLLPKLIAALLVAAPAASAHPGSADCGFRFLPSPSNCRGPAIRIGTPRLSITFGPFGDCGRPRPVHQHHFTTICEREWVAPVYRTVVAGYDHCHRPIYRQFLVRAGYWASVRYDVCGCGVRTRR